MKYVLTEDDKKGLHEGQQKLKQTTEVLAERLLEEKYATPEYADVALGIDEAYDNPLTRRRAANTIIKMDNQERFFEDLSRYMNEQTFTANFGAPPQAIIRSIRIANPNSIIEDISDVQTLSGLVGMIGYIEPIFSRSIRGATAGNLLVESKAKDYGAENIDESIGTGNASSVTFTGTLTYIPLRPGKGAKLIVAGVDVATAGSDGVFTNNTGYSLLETSSGVNSINYTTGVYTVTFATAPALSTAIVMNYNYDTEQNTAAHGDVELKWRSQGVTAEMHPLNFTFSLTSMLLGQTANFSVEEVMNDAATQYLKNERDRRGVEQNVRLALSNALATFDASASASGDNNNKMRAQMLELAIESAADRMYEDKGRGAVTYIIAGSQASTYMSLLDNFRKDSSNMEIGAYRVGYLGKAPVIKARVTGLGQDEILVGYKNSWGEAPFIHCDYLDFATESLTLKDFNTQKGLASYYVNHVVEPKFVRKIKINNIPNT
jgi:hypothetical protein